MGKSRDPRRSAWLLAERVKELQCLYRIADLYNRPSPSLDRVTRPAAAAIKAALQAPSLAVVRIEAGGCVAATRGWKRTPWRLARTFATPGGGRGVIEACYRERPVTSGPVFLGPERALLDAVADLTENLLARRAAEESMRRTAERLRAQKRRLEHRTIALRVLTSEIEAQKADVWRHALAGAEAAVRPALRLLEDAGATPAARRAIARSAERGLASLHSRRSRASAGDLRSRLSLREAEVAELVRGGSASKEIAAALGVSVPTVERHRHNIRRKLGIDGGGAGLAAALRDAL